MSYSYLTQSEKTSYGDVFFNIADTFARPIVMYKTAEKVVINPNPGNNFLFPQAPSSDVVQNVIQSGVFEARIKYNAREDTNLMSSTVAGGDQVLIEKEDGLVRIKVDATGAAFLFGTTRIEMDEDIFDLRTSKRPHGLFKPDFYTFYLKKIN